MLVHHVSVSLPSAEDTANFAVTLGEALHTGDTLLLSGPVGAGKTHFARHLIQSLLFVSEDVPSPTFTLVQTYDTRRGLLWHADLYRIMSAHEIEELGLADAFDTAICLVEWPDRLGTLAPSNALSLTFDEAVDENARCVTACWTDPRWTARLENWGPA